jgi:hypothetical protein
MRAKNKEIDMMRGKTLLGTALIGLAALTVSVGWAWDPVARTEFGEGTLPSVTPPMVVGSPTLQADQISAQLVRARTIYANRIDARQVHGVIYQTGGVMMTSSDSLGDIKSPEVIASVIYADEIRANEVVADVIYVRNLRQR